MNTGCPTRSIYLTSLWSGQGAHGLRMSSGWADLPATRCGWGRHWLAHAAWTKPPKAAYFTPSDRDTTTRPNTPKIRMRPGGDWIGWRASFENAPAKLFPLPVVVRTGPRRSVSWLTVPPTAPSPRASTRSNSATEGRGLSALTGLSVRPERSRLCGLPRARLCGRAESPTRSWPACSSSIFRRQVAKLRRHTPLQRIARGAESITEEFANQEGL